MSNYFVEYGVSSVNLDNIEVFNLLRDAKTFANSVDLTRYKTVIVYKLLYESDGKDSFASGKIVKYTILEPGVCEETLLKAMNIRLS